MIMIPPIEAPEVSLDDDAFARLEAAGHIRLSTRNRRVIQKHLNGYIADRHNLAARFTKKDRDEVTRCRKHLERVITVISSSEVVRFRIDEIVDANDELDRLTSMRDHLAEYRQCMGGRGEPGLGYLLSMLMSSLEPVYIRAGGRHSRVRKITRRKVQQRVTPFIDFMIALLDYLPEHMRTNSRGQPLGHQALASQWERDVQSGKRKSAR